MFPIRSGEPHYETYERRSLPGPASAGPTRRSPSRHRRRRRANKVHQPPPLPSEDLAVITTSYGGVTVPKGDFGKLRDAQGADHLILKTALLVLKDAEVHVTQDEYFHDGRPRSP